MKDKEGQVKDGIEKAFKPLNTARTSEDNAKIRTCLTIAKSQINIALENLK
jgi:hypothetical protein